IVSISIENLQLATEVLLSPVTVRTRVVRRTHVEHGTLDRFVISSEGDRVELVNAIEFGFHVPSRAFADVTIDTLEPRVRRVMKRHKLRLHHCVTRLPAECH